MFLATGCGLGYLPIAPGSWGALGGVALAILCANLWLAATRLVLLWGGGGVMILFPANATAARVAVSVMLLFYGPYLIALLVVAAVGVWAAERAERYLGRVDPGCVVIDEISGQLIAYLGAFDWARFEHLIHAHSPARVPTALLTPELVNWKYLLAGFILFRGFDTWKPFPASSAEHLHGGWGVMADDWVAGIYAALALGIARWLGF